MTWVSPRQIGGKKGETPRDTIKIFVAKLFVSVWTGYQFFFSLGERDFFFLFFFESKLKRREIIIMGCVWVCDGWLEKM